MNKTLDQAIDELVAEITAAEAAIRSKKTTVNTLCGVAGRDPLYPLDEPETAVPTRIRPDQFYGQPLAFTFKTQERGEHHYTDGEVKPYEKVWFAVPTERHPVGVFAYVKVGTDAGDPRVIVFSILSYPNDDRPDFLR